MWEEMNRTGVYKCPYSMRPESYSESQTTYIRCAGHESHKMYSPEASNVIEKFCDGDFKQCNYYQKYEEEKTMSAELTATTETAISASYKKAYQIHIEVKTNGELAEKALLNMCKGLKQIRDEELYKELGFDSFEKYVEENGDYSIKARQAYTYISTYERLGPKLLQSNAGAGITKLSLLAEVPGYERAEFLEEHDLEGLSVSELKKELEVYKQKAEQLSLLETELETVKDDLIGEQSDRKMTEDEKEALLAQLKATDDKKAALEKELAELKAKPVDVAVAEPSEEQLEKIRDKAEKEVAKKIVTIKKEVEFLKREKSLSQIA